MDGRKCTFDFVLQFASHGDTLPDVSTDQQRGHSARGEQAELENGAHDVQEAPPQHGQDWHWTYEYQDEDISTLKQENDAKQFDTHYKLSDREISGVCGWKCLHIGNTSDLDAHRSWTLK